MVVDGDKVEIPLCAVCRWRDNVDLRMRLDSMGNKNYLWWCSKCRICVVNKQKAFISKNQIERWGVDFELIPQVK